MHNDDKTVIAPAIGTGGNDRTLVIPTPGRNHRQPPGRRGQPPRVRSPSRPNRSAPAPHFAIDRSETGNLTGLNRITAAASDLLALLAELRNLSEHPDANGLRNQLIDEIKLFENRLREIDTPNEIVVSARYCLCTALDEAILNTPWGVECGWAQHSMLSTFHNETFGGEKFFLILSRLLETPAKYIDALELLYLILAQGFSGKYRLEQRGHLQLEKIKDNLYQAIRRQRGEFERDLSPRWQGMDQQEKSISEYIPLWVYLSVCLFILVVTYAGFRLWQSHATEPVAAQLAQIASLDNSSAIPAAQTNKNGTQQN
ncbi:MAG: hypothetical protein CSA50_07420 [Gammaproteobacteria bacterium]|nr:MAG: hypothetical protein CSA50_07420 [Gammaproteobacteria bacterium]